MGVGGEAAIHNETNLQNTQVPLVLQNIRVAECHFSLSAKLSPSQGFRKVFCVEHAIVSVIKISLVGLVLVFKVCFQVK